MRFLHTGDWHLGKRLRTLPRWDEYEAVLAEVLDIARGEGVDCLLIAGDIFDSPAPPPDAERLLYQFFRELWGSGIKAVAVGGNHDDARRLEALAKLSDLVGVHIRGEPATPESGGLIEIPSRDGRETALIAALPWVHERYVLRRSLMEDRSHTEYAHYLGEAIGAFDKLFRADTVNIFLSHLMIEGAMVGGGEREIHLTNVYAVKQEQLPRRAQYIALGHLHKPQAVLEFPPARYSGSLLQLDFGEREQEKSVLVVDAAPGRPATVESRKITEGRALRELRGTLSELAAKASEVGDAYLKVLVDVPGPLPNLTEQVREILPNAVDVRANLPDRERAPDISDQIGLSPMELLARYHRESFGSELRPAVGALFQRLLEEAEYEAA